MLTEVDAYKEILHKLHAGKVYEVFAKYSPHPSCPGVSGNLKTVEVVAGLALPQTASIIQDEWEETRSSFIRLQVNNSYRQLMSVAIVCLL